MCLARNRLSLKARRFLAIGNICLFTSISMSLLQSAFAHQHEPIYDGLRGFLLGLAITFNFYAFRRAKSRPDPLA